MYFNFICNDKENFMVIAENKKSAIEAAKHWDETAQYLGQNNNALKELRLVQKTNHKFLNSLPLGTRINPEGKLIVNIICGLGGKFWGYESIFMINKDNSSKFAYAGKNYVFVDEDAGTSPSKEELRFFNSYI